MGEGRYDAIHNSLQHSSLQLISPDPIPGYSRHIYILGMVYRLVQTYQLEHSCWEDGSTGMALISQR
jgi:hypothetical protein